MAIKEFLNEAFNILDGEKKQKKSSKNKKSLTESKWVNIEDYLPDEAYVESMDLHEEVEDTDDSTTEYSEAYKNKINERIKTYRKMCDLDESVDITEEHINKHSRQLKTLCLKKGGTPEQVKEQLLKGYYK